MSKGSKRLATMVAVATAVAAGLFAGSANAETLSLAQAIEMGTSKSPSVRAAKARTDAADAQIGVAKAGYLPQVEIAGGLIAQGSGSYGSEVFLPPAPPREFESRRVSQGYGGVVRGTLRWTLWDFGKTSNAVSAASASHESSSLSLRETTNNTAASIANAYLTLYFQERFLEAASATFQTRDKLNAITKGLVKNGILPPVEEIRASSRLEAARRDMERAKAGTEDARINLAVNLGMEPSASIKTVTPKLAHADLDPAGAVREGESKRPIVAAAERFVEARKAEKDAATSAFLPSIVASGTTNNTLLNVESREFRQDNLFGNAQLVLQQNLDLSLFSRVDQAEANIAAAEADLEATRRDVRGDAARAAVAVKSTALQVQHAKKAEEGSQAVRAIVEQRYIRGLASPLELVDAEDSDIAARLSRIQAELDLALAIVRLQVATGRPITSEVSQ